MPKPKSPIDAVDPGHIPSEAARVEATHQLEGAGWPADDAKWLAPIVLSIIAPEQPVATTLTEEVEHRLVLFQWAWRACEGNRDSALLLALAILCGIHPWGGLDQLGQRSRTDHGVLKETEQRSIVAEFMQNGVDFSRAVRQGWAKPLVENWTNQFDGDDAVGFATMRRLLLGTGAVRLDRVVDLDRMRSNGAGGTWGVASGGGSTNGARHWNDGVAWSDPTSMRVWLWYDGPALLEQLLPVFTAEPLATLPSLAAGLLSEVLNTFGRFGYDHHYLSFEMASSDLRTALLPFLEHLSARFDLGSKGVLQSRELWLVYFRLCFDGAPRDCSSETRKKALTLASEDLARLRKVFKAATAAGDTPEAKAFLQARHHFDNCCLTLARHGSIWSCLKPLLLGLRMLNTPSVATDLRFWSELALTPPPMPWNHLPNMMAVVVHTFAGKEEESDPELTALREGLASYCLERLTDRLKEGIRKGQGSRDRTDDDMVEPVAAWRYCFVRAISDLRANPEGRGHRTLFWSSEHDSDESVRKAALQAYDTIRHARGLPERLSPRRAVMSALWWLRQAHLLGLGIQPDRDLAQRTRQKELTRTKEAERAGAPPETD